MAFGAVSGPSILRAEYCSRKTAMGHLPDKKRHRGAGTQHREFDPARIWGQGELRGAVEEWASKCRAANTLRRALPTQAGPACREYTHRSGPALRRSATLRCSQFSM